MVPDDVVKVMPPPAPSLICGSDDQLYDQGKDTATGKELDAEAKMADLKLKLGQEVLPIYAKGLELATSALVKFNAFANSRCRKQMTWPA